MNANNKSAGYGERVGRRASLAGLSLALMLGCYLQPLALPAQAAIAGDPRLGQLEIKFFKHSYKTDSDAARLDRLDKLVFGEVRSGSDDERLKALADTVPNLSSVSADDADSADKPSTASTGSSGSGRGAAGGGTFGTGRSTTMDVTDQPTGSRAPGSSVLAGESKYPAITALEQSVFKRDYAGEPVADRLNRLETKVFGKPSKFTDMSERVDALKDRTRVDIAKKPPPGSDWVDEDDDDANYPQPNGPTAPTARTDGDDGRSFSGRNLRKDMQKAFGGTTGSYGSGSYGSGSYGSGSYGTGGLGSAGSTGGSGAYGMGSYGNAGSGSGSYGSGGTTPFSSRGRSSSGAGVGLIDPDDDMPQRAPTRSASGGGSQADAPMMGAVGISQKVASLETAVLGQNFNQDPLTDRVSRLEKSVFPKTPDANADLSLPVRVSKLLEKVPIRSKPAPAMASRQRKSDDDFDDDDMSMGSMAGMGSMSGMGSGQIASRGSGTSRSGGLGKIINSLGNMLGGGYAAGYSMPMTNMVRDPSTGYLIDGSGNMINPTTGMVMGRSTTYSTGLPMGMGMTTGIPMMPATGYASPYNTYPYGNALPMGGYPYGTAMPMGGYSSFNNGFSPYGIGAGGGGIRFGTGGFGLGGMRMGGMWP